MGVKNNLLKSFDNKVGNVVSVKFGCFCQNPVFFVQKQFGSAHLIGIIPLGQKENNHVRYRLNIICISNQLKFSVQVLNYLNSSIPFCFLATDL
jgi:hypothetical protein